MDKKNQIVKYILDKNGNPKEEKDLLVWAKQFEKCDRTLKFTKLLKEKGTISTVFLGIDHSFGGGKPLLFETMVFGGVLDGEQECYHTKKEALAGHKIIVAKVKKKIKRQNHNKEEKSL